MDHTEFFLHIWKNLSVTGLADNFGFSDIEVDHVCRFVEKRRTVMSQAVITLLELLRQMIFLLV